MTVTKGNMSGKRHDSQVEVMQLPHHDSSGDASKAITAAMKQIELYSDGQQWKLYPRLEDGETGTVITDNYDPQFRVRFIVSDGVVKYDLINSIGCRETFVAGVPIAMWITRLYLSSETTTATYIRLYG